MTESKIPQISALLQGMQNLSATPETSNKTDAVFGALLSQTASNGYEQQYPRTQQIGKNSVSTENNQKVYEKEAAQNNFKDTSFVKKTSTEIMDRLPEDAKEQIETVAEEVKNVLKDKLNVSEEELVQAMEQLGINLVDLADSSKVMQLAMELTGSQDGSELLLIPDFPEMMTEIRELFTQLAESLNLTPEEMQQLSVQLQEMQQAESVETEVTEQPQTETVSLEQAEVSDDTAFTEAQKVQTQSVETQKVETQNADELVEEPETEEKVQVSNTEDMEEDAADGQDGKEQSGDSKQKVAMPENDSKPESSMKNNQQTHMSFQTTTQTINDGQTVEVVQTVTQSQIDVENLLHQISQMTKISVTQAQSSIEMQLNPENLGKVYLQVISKEGAITAQIAAQNEAVKEVLENQIAVLKENMNQQGMKIESIEVTIASHEFERNLEERQENPAREQQETEKSSRRGINLNSLDELEGLMSEEEVLAAKIMRDNGNSVDLTA